MDSIANLIKKRKVEKIPSQKGELLKFFRERVRDRKGKMYSYAFISMKLADAKMDIPDMCYLKSICVDAENRGHNFGKVWFGSLKIKHA